MTRTPRTLSTIALALISVAGISSRAQAAVVYSNLGLGAQSTVVTVPTNGHVGIGDDYDTGKSGNFFLTGLSFYGGLTDTRDVMVITFYDSNKNVISYFRPSSSPLQGVGLHTLQRSDFNQGDARGVSIAGKGYIVFSSESDTTSYIDSNGVQQLTPADSNPTVQLGFGGTPSIGLSDATLTAGTLTSHTSPTTTTGFYVTAAGLNGQNVQFSLSDASVPEPASLGLVALCALALKRRRLASCNIIDVK